MPKSETFQYTFSCVLHITLQPQLTNPRNDWRSCFLASWLKYPNPRRPDILASDIISKVLSPPLFSHLPRPTDTFQEVDVENGILKATRLIQIRGFAPAWLRNVFLFSVLPS